MPADLVAILFLIGLMAGTVDAIAGGGGLISLPVLLAVGVSPHLALGTNKLQSSVGTFMAAYRYHRKGLWSLPTVAKGLLFGFLGAVAGALSSQALSAALLKHLIPFLLLLILLYTLFSPKLGHLDAQPKLRESYFYPLFGGLLGFYDGFFGPGVGSLWIFAIVFFLGYPLTKATAYTKVFNLKSNLIAFACFALGGNVNYTLGLIMAAGQLVGGQLGAHLAMRHGAKFIRPVFMLMVFVTILSLLAKNYLSK